VVLGCAHPHFHRSAPGLTGWNATLDSAKRLALDSNYAAADSLLQTFSRDRTGSAEANEATFWRGVFLLGPASRGGNVHGAAQAFEDYLGSGAVPHHAEAALLQRSAHVIDSLEQARSLDSVPAVHLVVADDSTKSTAREQELMSTVKQLQDSLNKTTAELDRIKRRLSAGKP
jgi:hypothetical protein